jgi:hypothetical protein
MCPLCIGTATLLVSGGTSAGGLAALLVRTRLRKLGRTLSPPPGWPPLAGRDFTHMRRASRPATPL